MLSARTPATSYSPSSLPTHKTAILFLAGRKIAREPATGRCATVRLIRLKALRAVAHTQARKSGDTDRALRWVKKVGLTHGPCMKRDCLNNAGAWNEQWFCRRPTGRLYHIFVTRHWFLGATNRRELVQCGASSASFRVPGMLTGRFPWWPSLVSQFGIQNTPTRGTLKSTGRPSQFQMLACPAQCLPVL